MHAPTISMGHTRPMHRPDPAPTQPGREPATMPQPDDVPGVPSHPSPDIPLRDDPADPPLE